VRAHGLLDGTRDLEAADHACWVYDDATSFAVAARAYLIAGLARGDRLLWVGNDPTQAMELPDAERLVADGTLHVRPVAGTYESTERFRPEQQLAFYDAVTRQAIDDGYRGLCVVADVTDLVTDASRRADFVRWEHLADRFIAGGSGMSAMCAYDRSRLSDAALADVESVHPLVRPPADAAPEAVPFQLWFDGGRLTLTGTVDTFVAGRLAHVLAGTPVHGAEMVLDLGDVDFIDAAGCRVLASWARYLSGRGTRLRVLRAPRLFSRVWQLLGFSGSVDIAEPALAR
jgi:anti-anti-sigma factor